MVNAKEMALAAAKALDSKKGRDIKVLEIDKITTLADYFVICSGGSNTQINALCDEVEKELDQLGEQPIHREGYRGGTWVLLDYGCVAIHVFNEEARAFYGLERLWSDGHALDLTGVLTPDGQLDKEAMLPIYAAASEAAAQTGRSVALTVHRAFDVCADPVAALETAVELGACTILTSGQAASAPAGAELLQQLVKRAGSRVESLAGAGVSAETIPALAAQTGVRAFHLSGKQVLDSRMTFRREGVPMGLPGFSEFEVWQTSEEKVRAARQTLDNLI